VLRGDAKLGCDEPIQAEQILGRVILAQMDLQRRVRSYFRRRRWPAGPHQAAAPVAMRQK
jgi:hypothetical protein